MDKQCFVCGETKKLDLFFKRSKKHADGSVYNFHRRECIKCTNEIRRIRHVSLSQKEKTELYLERKEKLGDKIQEYSRKAEAKRKGLRDYKNRYQENSKTIKAKRKEYYDNNKEKVIESVARYVSNNLTKVRATQRARHAKRKEMDIAYSILKVLRTRVGSAIKRKGVKCNKTTELVGCEMLVLLKHLEDKFTEGMSFSNYGEWHIDHIRPCASFNLAHIEEQKQCFHFSNLQPLWAVDNFKKGAKIILNF